jgi:NAD(P)-dependent dehydrogenase (short-subunit alcohol dehydrogenase family)
MNSGARVVLVTGASSGLGKAICEHLSRVGYRVYGTSRKGASGKDGKSAFELITMDVDQDASVEAAIRAVIEREGMLHAVVSNAGMGIAGALEDTDSEEALAQFQTNFFGTHRVCRYALPYLRKSALAHIVVIGSIAGRVALPFQGMYCASKFALEGYCEALRMEMRGSGVQVSIVEPGDFATGFTAARQTTAASRTESVYSARFKKVLAVMEKDETSGADPVLVSRKVGEILEINRPALRYPVGAVLQTAVARAKPFVPTEIFEALIADHYKC